MLVPVQVGVLVSFGYPARYRGGFDLLSPRIFLPRYSVAPKEVGGQRIIPLH